MTTLQPRTDDPLICRCAIADEVQSTSTNPPRALNTDPTARIEPRVHLVFSFTTSSRISM